MIFFALAFPQKSAQAVSDGFNIAINGLLPSVFPLLAVSAFILKTGIDQKLNKLLYPVMGRIFKISGEECSAVLLGFLCGFPTGAVTASKLLENNSISPKEYERLQLFANNCGIGFIFSFLGKLFSSPRAALIIFISQLIACIIIARITSPKNQTSTAFTPKTKPLPGIAQAFTASVRQATATSALIGGFIIFFSFLAVFLESLLSAVFKTGFPWKALIYPIMELTGGASILAQYPHKAVLCAGAIGWSGLCVYAQTAAAVGHILPLSKKYLPYKLINSVLCMSICAILCFFFL